MTDEAPTEEAPPAEPGAAGSPAPQQSGSTGKAWRWILLGALAFVGIVVLSCTFFALRSCRSISGIRTEAQDAAGRFLGTLASGDTDRALELTTAEFQSSSSPDELRRLAEMAEMSEYDDVEFTGWNVESNIAGPSTASLEGKIHLRTDETRGVQITMEESGEQWKVRRVNFNLSLDQVDD